MQPGLYADAQTTRQPRGVPDRVLTIGAHPDDAEFGAGGTLAAWADAGCEITMLVVTDGSKGSWDTDMTHDRLIDQRRAEQEAAARVIGANEPVMLGHVDGELEYSMALRAELCLWIRRLRPDVVLTHDPWQRYQLHPDHRVAGIAAIDGVVAARDHLFFPEQLGSILTDACQPRELRAVSIDIPGEIWVNSIVPPRVPPPMLIPFLMPQPPTRLIMKLSQG